MSSPSHHLMATWKTGGANTILANNLHWRIQGEGVVSYPDPNVRNDDYRLQYNITYRERVWPTSRSKLFRCAGMLALQSESRARVFSEGTTESQDAAWGEETDRRRALSATDDEFSSALKT